MSQKEKSPSESKTGLVSPPHETDNLGKSFWGRAEELFYFFISLLIGLSLVGILLGLFAYSFEMSSRGLQSYTGEEGSPIVQVWPIFMIIALSGAFGGSVHHLESDSAHSLSLPLGTKRQNTGIFGHIFIGFCGAIVATALFLVIFRLPLSDALNPQTDFTDGIIVLFYLAGIGIVGGYSGLPIISLVSNAAIKKLQREVDQLKYSEQKTLSRVEELEDELEEKEGELDEVQKNYILLLVENYITQNECKRAIDLLENSNEQFKETYEYHIVMAYCLKRLNDRERALEFAEKATRIKPSRLSYFNKACYMALLGRPANQVCEVLAESWTQAIQEGELEKEKFLKGLAGDADLDSIRNSKEYRDLRDQVAREK